MAGLRRHLRVPYRNEGHIHPREAGQTQVVLLVVLRRPLHGAVTTDHGGGVAGEAERTHLDLGVGAYQKRARQERLHGETLTTLPTMANKHVGGGNPILVLVLVVVLVSVDGVHGEKVGGTRFSRGGVWWRRLPLCPPLPPCFRG